MCEIAGGRGLVRGMNQGGREGIAQGEDAGPQDVRSYRFMMSAERKRVKNYIVFEMSCLYDV